MHQDPRTIAKDTLSPLRKAMRYFESDKVQSCLLDLFSEDAVIQLSYPFETMEGSAGFFRNALTALKIAFPDLERRDFIVMAGPNDKGAMWVGCCGYYTGTFKRPFLDIPPTGHMASMRFHEFYYIADGKALELQAIWDLPQLMMQANAWPMSPSLGCEWHAPAPSTQDGLSIHNASSEHAAASLGIVENMLVALANNKGDMVPPDYLTEDGDRKRMHLDAYWHSHCSWYGPSGIGTCRGISGFRNWHQIPYLNAMPNRVGDPNTGHFFADGDYVGFTAWPGMTATISRGGWLGIAPSGQEVTMRSLDFWRCEHGLIHENWVLVDLLDVYHQLGVDVLARLREFNKARAI